MENMLLRKALLYKPQGRRNVGLPEIRWSSQFKTWSRVWSLIIKRKKKTVTLSALQKWSVCTHEVQCRYPQNWNIIIKRDVLFLWSRTLYYRCKVHSKRKSGKEIICGSLWGLTFYKINNMKLIYQTIIYCIRLYTVHKKRINPIKIFKYIEWRNSSPRNGIIGSLQ